MPKVCGRLEPGDWRVPSVEMRPPRFQAAGASFHVTSHSVEECLLFKDHEDRDAFFAILGVVIERCKWDVLAYCLLGNHYHLVVRTNEETLSKGMQLLNGQYARTFNKRHGRRGALFRSRFYSGLIQTDSHLLETIRYVANNPGAEAADWQWGSYAVALGKAAPPQFVKLEHLLEQFGGNSTQGRRRFAAFVAERSPP